MAKSLFNFYLDDEEKEELQQKLVRLTGDQPKGLVASFYRVITKWYLHLPDDKSKKFSDAIAAEYEFSQKKNKRSNL